MNSSGYQITLILHIVSFTAAFGVAVVFPPLARRAAALGGSGASTVELLAGVSRRVMLPALLVTIALGFALSGMSQGAFEVGQTWISASLAVALALAAIVYFVLAPGLTRLASGLRSGDEGEKTGGLSAVRLGTAVYMLGFIAIVALMIFKPGV